MSGPKSRCSCSTGLLLLPLPLEAFLPSTADEEAFFAFSALAGLGARDCDVDEEDGAEAPEHSSIALKKEFTADPLLSANAFSSSLCNSKTVFICGAKSFGGDGCAVPFFVGFFLIALISSVLLSVAAGMLARSSTGGSLLSCSIEAGRVDVSASAMSSSASESSRIAILLLVLRPLLLLRPSSITWRGTASGAAVGEGGLISSCINTYTYEISFLEYKSVNRCISVRHRLPRR